jgi:isopenicillin N synthase-like dioxygenase
MTVEISEKVLPVISLAEFLADPSSKEAIAECKRAAEALEAFSALSIRDPRVSEDVNKSFLDMMEDYFARSHEEKVRDARPQFGYQVGATPELTEVPRCGRDDDCLEKVSKVSVML